MIKKTLKKENNDVVKLLASEICTGDGTLLTSLLELFNNFKFTPAQTRSVNLDEITESGIIQVIDNQGGGTLPLNMSASHNFFLMTLTRIEDTPYRRQVLLDIRTSRIYTRYRNEAGGWHPWVLLSNDYSTEVERIIGFWIDGKPIYRKTINVTMTATETSKSIATGITNMEFCIRAYGCGLYGTQIFLPFNFINSGGHNSFHITGKGTTIMMQNDGAYPTTTGYITLEYTKTTD